MPQSHAQIWLHVVFSTKKRATFLKDSSFREEMFRMLGHHVKETKSKVVIVGGHVDHVHMLVGLSRQIAVSKFVEVVKTETSRWAKTTAKHFAWQSGYGAFSVSHSNLPVVEGYIREQANHHAKMSWQDEFRLLCGRHGIEIDERYVWD